MRLLIAALAAVAAFGAPKYSPTLWSGMKYRHIGPMRGGRVTAVAGIPTQPSTYYMGSTGGGVWKTTDAGDTWVNVSDGFIPLGSMGAIEVSLSHPNVVYAGTGSSKIRSNVSIGRGIWRSNDAGKSWKFIGLKDVGQIATVRVHPSNPDIVWVAALGNPFAPNKERGIYKTTDGGATWKNVLFVSDSCGAADVEIQPGHPDVLFASMWHGQRKPWTIVSGAKEGGIYKSTDGGASWTKLAGGLPDDLFGRSNIAIANVRPERIYALIEAKPGSGLYRSEDSGATWTLVNGQGNLITRPFYYTTLGVDPTNSDVLYIGNESWYKSTDGGRTFRRASGIPHGDHHDIWINPSNSDYMIQANDGGANVSVDGGRTWSGQANQPTAEIYQVAVDNQFPYRVYGAQQDNTTVIAPSLPDGSGQDFRVGPGCETGPIMPDPARPEIVYGSCKGQFTRLNLHTANEQRYWVGAESLYGNGGSTLIYRFQRVSPMEVSPHDSKVVYYGSQFVHRTRDGGKTWDKISPDMTAFPPGEPQDASGTPITRDATGEEVYSTLYTIRESPVQKGVIWTGSNDGPIWVTRDDGKTWQNVTPRNILPGGRVQNIEPSPHRAGTAYAAIYRYLLGDFAPYIYRTDDFGKTWTRLTDGANGIGPDEPTRVVREDPVRPRLLYAGTEFGMYVSFDDGANWQPFQMNLPHTPVTDMRLAHGDLVLSTQGRGFWILDNLASLREIDDAVAAAPQHLFKPRAAIRAVGTGRGGRGLSYPLPGAQIDYYLAKPPEGDLTLEILDATNNVIRTFTSAGTGPTASDDDGGGAGGDDDDAGPRIRSGPTRLDKSAGMHRFTWDLRYPGVWQNAARSDGGNGPISIPGRYGVRLSSGSWNMLLPFTVEQDPRTAQDGVSIGDLSEQFLHNSRVRDLVSLANQTVARVRAALSTASGEREIRLRDLSRKLITPSVRYSKPELQTQITYLYTVTNSTDQKPGRDVLERYEALKKELDERIKELNAILQ